MAQGPALILRTLDRHLGGPVKLRLMGGAALVLAYGLDRSTEDADLLMDDAEAQFLAEERNFGEALERTNAELEAKGLYISHLWGPEQQILTPSWRERCRPVPELRLQHVELEALGPLDLIVSKLARGDEGDLDDIRHLIRVEGLGRDAVLEAIRAAQVPEILREAFDHSRPRVEGLLPRAS